MIMKFTIGICCRDNKVAEKMIRMTLNNYVESYTFTPEIYGEKYTNNHITFVYLDPNRVTEDNIKGMHLDKLYYENELSKREKIKVFNSVKHTMNDYLVPIPIDFSVKQERKS